MGNSQGSFKAGDKVVVKPENPEGNPRTPAYIRGKKGVIAEVHGVIDNPRDHCGLYPPLYTVVFEVKDVFGTLTQDQIWIDLHEDWLDRGCLRLGDSGARLAASLRYRTFGTVPS